MVSLGNTGLDVEKLFIYLSGMKKTLFILLAIALMAPSCKKCYTCSTKYYSDDIYQGYAQPSFLPGISGTKKFCDNDISKNEGQQVYSDSMAGHKVTLIYACSDN